MSNTMTDEARQERQKHKILLARVICVLLGVASAVSCFFPYITFLFKNQVFQVSAFDLLVRSGFRVYGPQMSGLVTVPLFTRVAVVMGFALALVGIVLVLCKKAALAGVSFLLSGISPLLVLLSTSSIQTAVASLNVLQITVQYHAPYTLILVLGVLAAVMSLWTRGGEKLAESIFLVCACVSIGTVIIITIYVVASGAPAIAEIGFGNFIFGKEWKPEQNTFGILPMILASIFSTIGAVIIGVPIGVLTAIFLSETAKPLVAKVVHPCVELLAGIPSVIYGFFGLVVLVKVIDQVFGDYSFGQSMLAAILILSIMVLPTIVSVSETALRAVPQAYREASLALGCTPTKTIFKVTLPAARSGVLSGIILGVGRAIGETMAVIMVAGNVVNMPSLLGSVRLLTSGIALELSYSSGLHRQALFAIGLVLFVFIMIVDVLFTYISKKGVQMHEQ